jgi:hypothetical protein
MKYSGPRMLLHHPLLAINHFLMDARSLRSLLRKKLAFCSGVTYGIRLTKRKN